MTTLNIDFTNVENCEKEIEMLGQGLARSCTYLAESSKKNADTHQMKLANEMALGDDADLATANDHANKFKYFESQQRKWLSMLKIVNRAGYKDEAKPKKTQSMLNREELEAVANALSK